MENKKETTFTKGKETRSTKNDPLDEEKKVNPQEIFSNFARTTSGVVGKAALILEEEVAAGIIAAKQLENQLIDPKKIRSEKDEVIIQRFRNDAHEVIDIMMDAVTVVSKYGKKLTNNLISVVDPADKSSESTGIPTLEIPEPIKAGERSEVTMTLENNSKTDTGPFTILTTDLINKSGKKISASNISINPKEIKIKGSQKLNIKIMVKVPEKTAPGSYSGLLQATNLNNFKAILVVNVAD